MKLIVFTRPDFFEDEAAQITQLFENGLSILHLRKPASTREEMARLLMEIPSEHLSKVTLHDHFDLLEEFSVGGVHLNSRNPHYLGKKKVRISKSCHSFLELKGTELEGNKGIADYDYVTLSPIFDSVSKQGYASQFSHEDLLANRQLINAKVMALGGVTYDNIQSLKQYGFGGAAMLGCIWKDFNIDHFKECLHSLNS